jgi:hypothetical protein
MNFRVELFLLRTLTSVKHKIWRIALAIGMPMHAAREAHSSYERQPNLSLSPHQIGDNLDSTTNSASLEQPIEVTPTTGNPKKSFEIIFRKFIDNIRNFNLQTNITVEKFNKLKLRPPKISWLTMCLFGIVSIYPIAVLLIFISLKIAEFSLAETPEHWVERSEQFARAVLIDSKYRTIGFAQDTSAKQTTGDQERVLGTIYIDKVPKLWWMMIQASEEPNFGQAGFFVALKRYSKLPYCWFYEKRGCSRIADQIVANLSGLKYQENLLSSLKDKAISDREAVYKSYPSYVHWATSVRLNPT